MKQDIINQLEALLKENISEETITKADELNREFILQLQTAYNSQYEKHLADGGSQTDFAVSHDPLDHRFNELIHILHDREKKMKKIQKEELEAKLQAKKDIIAELEKLIQEETNIGKAFHRFKELQQAWKDAGHLSHRDYKNLQGTYQRNIHNFYYNMKLNKDLRDLDFKRNLELRQALLTKMESLLQIESARGLERMLNLYRMEWNDMGPTSPETIDGLRTRYRDLIAQAMERIRSFEQQSAEEEHKNLEEKKKLIEKIAQLAAQNFDTARLWQKNTELAEEIMNQWKTIGYAPKAENETVWKEFRAALNEFYKNKRDFFSGQKKSFRENKEKKSAIIEQAIALASAEHENWDVPTKQLLDLQKSWKESGPIEHHDENKLWKKFREACDAFFEKKKAFFGERDSDQLKNLQEKEALIRQIETFEPTGNTQEDLKTLKTFSARWKEIPHVPFKDKQRIYEHYKKVLDSKYDSMKISADEIHMLKFKTNIDMLAQNDKSDKLIQKEKLDLKNRINKLQATISQYETNLGFFARAKNMGNLLTDAESNLQKAKTEMEMLKKKLKLVSEIQPLK